MARARDEEGGAAFGRPMADSMTRIGRQLKARERKRPEPLPPAENAKTKSAVPAAKISDDDAFRQATAGSASLGTAPRRVTARTKPLADMVAVREAKPIDPTADEHFDIRFSDLFIRGRAAGVSRETTTKLECGEFAVRSHVDLHGMAFDDAKAAVDRFLADRQKRGDRCVLVITGKGRNSPRQIAVLRERIPEWLARGPSSRRVLAFVTARPCDGGEGALYVLLRKNAARKTRIIVEAGGGV